MKRVAIGFDVGTSSLKATVIDLDTQAVVTNERFDYIPSKELAPGVFYASKYEETLMAVLKSFASRYDIKSIAFSTQMYSLCEETDQGVIVYQWNSLWPKDEEKEIELRELMKPSGCPVDTLYPAYKLYTDKRQNRENMLPYGLKEHLMKFFCGRLVSDYTCASASGLYDPYRRKWNERLLERLGFSVDEMPAVLRYDQIAGYLRFTGPDGLEREIAVVPGLGDGPSASYACKDITNTCANIGTSMAVRSFVNRVEEDYFNQPWVYAMDESRFVVGGISSNSCSVLDRARIMGLLKNVDFESANNRAIMFFPWLHGERTPYWSSNLQGTFIGMSIGDNLNSINVAIIKGIAFTAARLFHIVRKNVQSEDMLIVAGGGVKMESILEVLAGCLYTPIGIMEDTEYLGAYGAATIAAEALGISVSPEIHVERVIQPTHQYREEFENWMRVADDLAELYERWGSRKKDSVFR